MTASRAPHCDPAMLHRRTFLTTSLRVAAGVALAPWLLGADPTAASPVGAPAKSLILLFMSGGMSHLDTLDPKDDAAVMGATTAIPTRVDGVKIGRLLPNLAQVMDRCALIRSLTSNQGAHEQGQYLLRTGYVPRGDTRHPCFGAWADRLLVRGNATLPGSVTIGAAANHPGPGFLPPQHAPLPVGDPAAGLADARPPKQVDAERRARRLSLLAEQDGTADDAPGSAWQASRREALALMQSPDLAAFDLTQEDAATAELYGKSAFGRGCLLARRLVERGVRVVEVELGGWDFHAGLWDRIDDHAAQLDTGLPALISDLERRGLLGSTLVALVTEFGRTPKINDNDGRDHHPSCFSALLAGGGVRGGRVHGASDGHGMRPAADPVTPADLQATLCHALGIVPDAVVHAANGRPFTPGNKGAPLRALFA